jgi:flavin reductase (DIM6/NTAB) family NADH-FMN oxidoreductase RutF
MQKKLKHSLVIRPSILYFGTPVALISTLNEDGTANLSPMSSLWMLDDRLVLGMGNAGQGCENLLRTREAVVNLPGPEQQAAVELLAPTTGRYPVPEYKRAMGYRYEADKFGAGGLTAVSSNIVAAPRVGECPAQLEVQLLAAHAAAECDGKNPAFMMLETRVVCVHAHEDIVIPGTNHVDTVKWSPLLYVFRHYFGTGERLGRNFRAEN